MPGSRVKPGMTERWPGMTETWPDDRDMAGDMAGPPVFMVFVPPYSTPYSRAQLVQKIFSRDSFFRPGNDVKVATASGQRESMCG